MCGINGILLKNNSNKTFIEKQLQSMNNQIIHRGPDAMGFYVASKENNTIGMAMRRLSIIDLHSGNQPMYSDDKSIVIVFNGEIYNFKELRSDLAKTGIIFRTNSDTEVILKLYESYGEDSFKLLDGMFGFSIHDNNKNKIIVARDYFGEKPIYYKHDESGFYWASELKSIINTQSIKPALSKIGLNLFFRLTYIPAPFTIYDDIYKLEANKFMVYDLNHNKIEIKDIHTKTNHLKSDMSFNDASKKVKDMVFKSVESRSISDVPLGTFLSGGVDSSIVSLCLASIKEKKIDTFSIGFEKTAYNETDKSQIVAKLINSNHHEFVINENDMRENVDFILNNFDEPFADSSSLPTYLVSNKTKTHVKVALTGDGGDEVFGGYNKYYIGKLNNRYTKVVPEILHQQINKFTKPLLNRKEDNRGLKYKIDKLLKAINYEDSYYWDIISLGFSDNDLNVFFNPNFKIENIFDYYKIKSNIKYPKSLNDFRTIDLHLSLEGDMLVKVDRTSMLNSLECRAPFLNKEIYDFTMTLPEEYLLKKWSKKHILKEAFKSEFPDGFLDKSKQGFGVPVGDWLRHSLKNELLSYIEPKFLRTQQIFNSQYITELVLNHVNGKHDNAFKVWSFFCFQKWYVNTFEK